MNNKIIVFDSQLSAARKNERGISLNFPNEIFMVEHFSQHRMLLLFGSMRTEHTL
jgi:urease gamma subunit